MVERRFQQTLVLPQQAPKIATKMQNNVNYFRYGRLPVNLQDLDTFLADLQLRLPNMDPEEIRHWLNVLTSARINNRLRFNYEPYYPSQNVTFQNLPLSLSSPLTIIFGMACVVLGRHIINYLFRRH